MSSLYPGRCGGIGLVTAACCAACTFLAIHASFESEDTLSATASIGTGRTAVGSPCAGDFENVVGGGHLVGTPPLVELVESGWIAVLPGSAEQVLGLVGPLHFGLFLVGLHGVLVGGAGNHAAD